MQFTAKAVAQIRARAAGLCELCGRPETEAMQAHHRRPRGMGGSKDPVTGSAANGLWLHYECHRIVEENREHAIATGYLVWQHQDPTQVAVFLPNRPAPVFLCLDGDLRSLPPRPKGQDVGVTIVGEYPTQSLLDLLATE